MTRTSVVIPIRGLHGGKSRLAGQLHADQRSALIASMATRVICAVADAGVADSIVIVSREADLLHHLPVGEVRTHLVHQPDHSIGLNAAIDLGRREAMRWQAESMLVLSADLPELTSSAVALFVRRVAGAAVAVVADRAGLGTNALLLRGASALARFGFHFGHDSRRLHRAESLRLGLDHAEQAIPEIALDLDTPDDWAMLNGDVRHHLLIPRMTPRISRFGAAGRDPQPVLERA